MWVIDEAETPDEEPLSIRALDQIRDMVEAWDTQSIYLR